MAANHHPEYAKVLSQNKNAFYRKTGMAAAHLDHSKTAVERKSNTLIENSRLAAGKPLSSKAGSNNQFSFQFSSKRII